LKQELVAGDKLEARVDKMHAELTSQPGSTWADYSARRLITQQRENFKPAAEQFGYLPEGDTERWGTAVLEQIKWVSLAPSIG
jgi:hypothetical protein